MHDYASAKMPETQGELENRSRSFVHTKMTDSRQRQKTTRASAKADARVVF
jgi:hypothetical protein